MFETSFKELLLKIQSHHATIRQDLSNITEVLSGATLACPSGFPLQSANEGQGGVVSLVRDKLALTVTFPLKFVGVQINSGNMG